ncbi:hypothetical protein [Marinimicrobium sp. C2-29]|uniref:hypothetical protein n=1 Tax=Marinimicrobium sp. C2-29 TaxID=3139825 RepID=UPI0031394ADB
MSIILRLVLSVVLSIASCLSLASEPPQGSSLRFTPSGSSEYTFNTGTVSGKLRADGESVGPGEVIYSETGQKISRVYGWLNHYRVFSDGVRYGRGMRHLPSNVEAHEDGSVTVVWPAEETRPFRMQATYRWVAPNRLDVDTEVRAEEALSGFELFLASYFPDTFTDVRIPVEASDGDGPDWVFAPEEDGYRQAFARDDAAVALLEDGRWELEPHPIEWTLQPQWVWRPMSLRRDPETGVTVLFMTDREETFIVYSPHSTQRHYALYYSLFGRDLEPGEVATARSRAVVLNNPDEEEILREARTFFGD